MTNDNRDDSTPPMTMSVDWTGAPAAPESFPLRESETIKCLREKLDTLGPRASECQRVVERAYVAARLGKLGDCRSILAAHIGVERVAELIRLAEWGGE